MSSGSYSGTQAEEEWKKEADKQLVLERGMERDAKLKVRFSHPRHATS